MAYKKKHTETETSSPEGARTLPAITTNEALIEDDDMPSAPQGDGPPPPIYSYTHTDRHNTDWKLRQSLPGEALSQDRMEYLADEDRRVRFLEGGNSVAIMPQTPDVDEWAGFGVPENNVAYRPPAEEVVPISSGPNPNDFPTRDPITGRVTPALNTRIRVGTSDPQALNEIRASNAYDDYAETPPVEEEKPSSVRRLINGIFGNDSDGKPVTHVH